jgi:hypothetical protein
MGNYRVAAQLVASRVVSSSTELVSIQCYYVALFKVDTKPVRLKVFPTLTMKKAIVCDVTPCGSCENRRFGGTIASIIRVTRISKLGTMITVTGNRSTMRRNTYYIVFVRFEVFTA